MHWMYDPESVRNGAVGVSTYGKLPLVRKQGTELSRRPEKRSLFSLRGLHGWLFVLVFTVAFASGAAFHSFALSSDTYEQDHPRSVASAIAERGHDGGEEIGEIRVIVSSGDTLWELAKSYAPNDMDLREYVEQVIEYNCMASKVLQKGQVVRFPVALHDPSSTIHHQ
jgi:hypothetical protein